MSERFVYAYEAASRDAATVTYLDRERRLAFTAGARWLAQWFMRILIPDPMENLEGYPKKLMDGMTLEDMRKAIDVLFEQQPEPQRMAVAVLTEDIDLDFVADMTERHCYFKRGRVDVETEEFKAELKSYLDKIVVRV